MLTKQRYSTPGRHFDEEEKAYYQCNGRQCPCSACPPPLTMPVKKAQKEGHPPHNEPPSRNRKREGDDQTRAIPQRKQRRADRKRGKQFRVRKVIHVGEQPSRKMLKNGKIRQLNLPCTSPKNDPIPRKTRDFIERMARFKPDPTVGDDDVSPGRVAPGRVAQIDVTEKRAERKSDDEHRQRGTSSLSSKNGPTKPSPSSSEAVLQGIKPNETVREFSARLRTESRQMAVDLAREGCRQKEKRKAYNEKRRERLQRRKRKRRGEHSDSDVEQMEQDNEDIGGRISHLPAYWQEIVQNNGRPISSKKRKRMHRMEEKSSEKIRFNEQAERPPSLSVVPVRRSGR